MRDTVLGFTGEENMVGKIFTFLVIGLFVCSSVFASSTTTNYSLTKPAIGDSGWGTTWNDNADTIDRVFTIISNDVVIQNNNITNALNNRVSNDATGLTLTSPVINTNVSGTGFQNTNPTNLLINGDVEIWSAGAAAAPDGWTGGVYGSEVYAREASTIKIGTYSIKMTNNVGANGGFYQDGHIEKGIVYWQGRTVTLSFWVYCATADRARVSINDGVATSYSPYHTGDSTWQLLTVTHTIGGSATRIRIYGLILVGSAIDAYFDGAMLVEGSSAFAFSEKPIYSGGTVLTSGDVTIAGGVKGTIPIVSPDGTTYYIPIYSRS